MIDLVLEDAWKELLGVYKKGYDFLNEEDMRCLFYHLCAKRSSEINYIHAQKRREGTQRKYDLVVNDSLNKHRIAIELKCWLLKSSGPPSNRVDLINEQLKRLEDAVKSEKYDLAYLFVLDEFGQYLVESGLLKKVQTTTENVHFKYFPLPCKKEHERWGFNETSQECKKCETQIPCQLGQEYIRNWQAVGHMK